MSDFKANYSSEDIKRKIIEHGLKCTSQRVAVYRELLAKDHQSAEEIHTRVIKVNSNISVSTVYNSLEAFCEKRLIGKVNAGEGKMRYSWVLNPHAHLFCNKSKELIDFIDDELQEKVAKHLAEGKIKNFNIWDIQIVISGEKLD